MIDAVKPLTAKAKLATSRAELLAAMGYEEVTSAADGALSVMALPGAKRRSSVSAIGTRISQSVVGRWWHGHPMRSVAQLGQPLLECYAQSNPGKLIAYGAGTGALLWIVKPWKLRSVASVLTLILKSSAVSGMISDLVLKARSEGTGNSPPSPKARPDR